MYRKSDCMGEKLKISPKMLKGEEDYKTFSIRIKNKTVHSLDVISQKTGYSRNQIIGLLLQYAIENCEIESTNKNK